MKFREFVISYTIAVFIVFEVIFMGIFVVASNEPRMILPIIGCSFSAWLAGIIGWSMAPE